MSAKIVVVWTWSLSFLVLLMIRLFRCIRCDWRLGIGLRACIGKRYGKPAAKNALKLSFRKPEASECFDISVDAGHLLSRIGEQFKHADQHAVVAQLILFGDGPAQRHD